MKMPPAYQHNDHYLDSSRNGPDATVHLMPAAMIPPSVAKMSSPKDCEQLGLPVMIAPDQRSGRRCMLALEESGLHRSNERVAHGRAGQMHSVLQLQLMATQ